MTIELGWWIVPAAVTLAGSVFAYTRLPSYGTGVPVSREYTCSLQFMAACNVVLLAWLIWALVA